jgi:hypothetical protein
MKWIKFFIAIIVLLKLQQDVKAQTGTWKLGGNSLVGTEKFGSINAQPINFFTNNTQRMALTPTGLLGINTKTPKAHLHILRSGGAGVQLYEPNSTLVTESSNDNFISVFAPTKKQSGVLFGNTSAESGITYNSLNAPRSLQFRASFNTGMTLTGTGNLGIGTATPKAGLHILKGSGFALPPNPNSVIITENFNDNFFSMLAPSDKRSGILFADGFNASDGGILFNDPLTKRGLQFRTGGNITSMVVTSSGFVGINTISPASDLHVLHASGSGRGLRIQSTAAGSQNWNIAQASNGSLLFVANGFNKGVFDATSGSYSPLSDLRSKKDIEQAPDVMENLMQLEVKKYHFLENKAADKKQYGMIAQDVEKLFPEIVTAPSTSGSDRYAVNYSAYGVIAIKAIQEQQHKIETLEERIAILEAALTHAVIKNSSISTSTNTSVHKETGSNRLEQNQPNPFSQSTLIRYKLPQGSTGEIKIYDISGVLVKALTTSATQVTIDGSALKTGSYTYTLSVDGNVIGSKKMVVVK